MLNQEKSKYSLPMKSMKLGTNKYRFTTEGTEGVEGKEYSLTTKDTKSTKVITEMKQEENTSQRITAGTPAIIR